MATYTEYLADALRDWRQAERTLRRMEEDGRERWETRETEQWCAEAFAKCIDAHLMKVTAKEQLILVRPDSLSR